MNFIKLSFISLAIAWVTTGCDDSKPKPNAGRAGAAADGLDPRCTNNSPPVTDPTQCAEFISKLEADQKAATPGQTPSYVDTGVCDNKIGSDLESCIKDQLKQNGCESFVDKVTSDTKLTDIMTSCEKWKAEQNPPATGTPAPGATFTPTTPGTSGTGGVAGAGGPTGTGTVDPAGGTGGTNGTPGAGSGTGTLDPGAGTGGTQQPYVDPGTGGTQTTDPQGAISAVTNGINSILGAITGSGSGSSGGSGTTDDCSKSDLSLDARKDCYLTQLNGDNNYSQLNGSDCKNTTLEASMSYKEFVEKCIKDRGAQPNGGTPAAGTQPGAAGGGNAGGGEQTGGGSTQGTAGGTTSGQPGNGNGTPTDPSQVAPGGSGFVCTTGQYLITFNNDTAAINGAGTGHCTMIAKGSKACSPKKALSPDKFQIDHFSGGSCATGKNYLLIHEHYTVEQVTTNE